MTDHDDRIVTTTPTSPPLNYQPDPLGDGDGSSLIEWPPDSPERFIHLISVQGVPSLIADDGGINLFWAGPGPMPEAFGEAGLTDPSEDDDDEP